MAKRKIIQVLGLRGDWYVFSLDDGKEIKVWHELEGVADWTIDDRIEYVDYDELEGDFSDLGTLSGEPRSKGKTKQKEEEKVIEIRSQEEIKNYRIEQIEKKKKRDELRAKRRVQKEEFEEGWRKEMKEFRKWLDEDKNRGKGLITRNDHFPTNLRIFFSEALPSGRTYKIPDYWPVYRQWQSEKKEQEKQQSLLTEQEEKEKLLSDLEQLVIGTENKLNTSEQMKLLENLLENENSSIEDSEKFEKAEKMLNKRLTYQKQIEFAQLEQAQTTPQIERLKITDKQSSNNESETSYQNKEEVAEIEVPSKS